MAKKFPKENEVLNAVDDLTQYPEYLKNKIRYGHAAHAAPFGYINVSNYNSHANRYPLDQRPHSDIQVDPAAAPIVKRAFELYESGAYNLREVCEKIDEEYQKKFTNSTLHKILKNRFYIGQMQIKDKLYRHRYEHIIDQDLFFKVQEILKRPGCGWRKRKNNHCYRGIIKCGFCNHTIGGTTSKHKYVYYKCSEYAGKHGAEYMPERVLTRQFVDGLDTIYQSIKNVQQSHPGLSKLHNSINKLVETFKKSEALRRKIIFSVFDKVVLHYTNLLFTYKRFFDLMVHEPGYLEYKAEKGDDLYFDELNAYIDQLLTTDKRTPRSIQKATDSPDSIPEQIRACCEYQTTTQEIIKKLQIPYTKLQDYLLDLQLEGKIEEIEPDTWKKV